MRLWDLPGARRFVTTACDLLRDGSSVVVQFPGRIPDGFDIAVAAALGNVLDIGRLQATVSPLQDLAHRYAQHPQHIGRLQDLCEDPGFRGRLVRLDGLDSESWPNWCTFLSTYAEISRSRPLFGRSLFLVLLAGSPPPEAPPADIGLACRRWDGLPDDVDLLMFATEQLQEREDNPLLRSLLATTIARVAAWDFDTAAVLVAQDYETIMDPGDLLRETAQQKGWTVDTPLDWGLGTASRTGSAHPAKASLDDPPSELQRRVWSAQLSVLFPWIETRRHATISANLFHVKRQMRADGDSQGDPFELELGELLRLLRRRGTRRQVWKIVRMLRDARNELAHRGRIPLSTVLDLIESTGKRERR